MMPGWMDIAWKEQGNREIPGYRHNPDILEYFKDAGRSDIQNDETSWCAAFVGSCLARADINVDVPIEKRLLARSYLKVGQEIKEPRYGAIAVFSRGDPNGWQGHVGFVTGWSDDNIALLGGNQSNAVNVTNYSRSRLLGFRWPDAEEVEVAKTKKIPASIRNNNPGAMYPGKSSKKFNSTRTEILKSGDGTHKIAYFPDVLDGAAALFYLLDLHYTGRTVEKAVQRWSGGYHVSSYLRVIEGHSHIRRGDMITKAWVRDPKQAIPFAKAMARHEAGKEYPMSNEQWEEAHARAFPGEIAIAVPPMPEKKPDNNAIVIAEAEPEEVIPAPKPPERVEKAAKQSTTILGAIVAAFGAAVQYLEEGVAIAVEAAAKVVEFGPVKGIGASLGANVDSIGFGLTVAAVVFVIHRRLNAAVEGKEG